MENVRYDVHDMTKTRNACLDYQFNILFAMFGSTVLVPILVGIDPAIALFSSWFRYLAHLTDNQIIKSQLTWVQVLLTLQLCKC